MFCCEGWEGWSVLKTTVREIEMHAPESRSLHANPCRMDLQVTVDGKHLHRCLTASGTTNIFLHLESLGSFRARYRLVDNVSIATLFAIIIQC